MHTHRLLFASLLWLMPATALAQSADTGAALARLNQCLKSGSAQSCTGAITAESQPFYKRFSLHGLQPCLPKKLEYVSQHKSGDNVVMRVGFQSGQRRYSTRLVLSALQGYRLNLPATLQLGLGKNWQQSIDMTEKLYVALKQQMGDKLSCGAIESFAGARTAKDAAQ